MPNNSDGDGFSKYLNVLKKNLQYVEDETFSWDDTLALLIIKLRNTDSLNKTRSESNATQIQLTSEREAGEGKRKTEDFFPTLTLNSTFKGWRIAIPARISAENIAQLRNGSIGTGEKWLPDTIQIRRRLLNPDSSGGGNPALQICYGSDLMPLRELLHVDDYIVIAKRRNGLAYEVFGVRGDVDLGSGKQMYLSDKSAQDSTTFPLGEIVSSGTDETGRKKNICFKTGLDSSFSRNRILFGAPGTGKSYTVDSDRKKLLGADNDTDYERVTFHPDYSYANFVGTYKPVMTARKGAHAMEKDTDYANLITGREKISDIAYEYVPGPFMRMYVNALKNAGTGSPRPYLLIIEEINRANAAAVFGDVFQLLDRDDDGVSAYPVQATEDIKNYLAKELGGNPEDYSKIRIPDNLFIWATMNSADQGVFPMDTAFKRRWDFTYLGIDDSDKDIRGKYVVVGSREKQRIEWNELRKAINEFLAAEKINEDKQLGPYFIPRNIVVPADGGTEIDSARFCDVFKHKVLMYLFEDAAKQKRGKLFEGSAKGQAGYSKICEAFDEQGIGIFHSAIQNHVQIQDLVINGHRPDADDKAGTGAETNLKNKGEP